jgi:hypothetical protein
MVARKVNGLSMGPTRGYKVFRPIRGPLASSWMRYRPG